MALHGDDDSVTSSPCGMRPMVLVVDDQATIRHLVSRVLATRGLDVHIAESVESAMRLASILRFDAAVIDLGMPGQVAGLRLLQWFRGHDSYHDVPLMILTGHLDLSDAVQDALRELHVAVFYKGQSLTGLVEHLSRAIVRHAPPPSPGGHHPFA